MGKLAIEDLAVEIVDGKVYPKLVEIVRGKPRIKMSPRTTHALVQSAILRILYRCANDRGCVAPEWDCHPLRGKRAGDTYVPDVSFVSNERLRALSPEEREAPPFAPDVAVEVWSPKSSRRYLNEKIRDYLAAGGLIVLDVNPYKRTIVAHSQAGALTFTNAETFEHPAVEWLRFEVAEAFENLDRLGR